MIALLVSLIFGVVVEGPSLCPTPAAVEERLRSLASATGGGEVARLATGEGGLRVTLVRADGTEAGSRTVAGEHSCDELADAAAVMIAAWQLEGAARPRLPAPPPPVVVAAAPAPAPAAAPAATPASRRRWELGAGLGAALAGADLAPAALVVASLGDRLGLQARALVSGNRETALPGGRASWRRALLAAGPHLRSGGARLFGEAHLGGGLSWLSIDGEGFANAQRHDDLVAGLEGGLRLGWNRAGARPWLELGAAYWPIRSVVYQLPDQRSAALPRLEGRASLGLSYGR